MGIRRVSDARALLVAEIEEAQDTHAHFMLTNQLINEISLQFGVGDDNDDGTSLDQKAKFDVWQICGGTFEEVAIEHTTALFTPSCPSKLPARSDPD